MHQRQQENDIGIPRQGLWDDFSDFFAFLKEAKPKPSWFAIITICYFFITVCDLLGLGALFLFIQAYISGSVYVLNFSSVHFTIGISELLPIIPIVWGAKFILVLCANYLLIRFSQNIIAGLRIKLVYGLFTASNLKTFSNQRSIWLDTINRQLSVAAASIIEPTLRGFFDLFLLFLACGYLFYLAPLMFSIISVWLVIGMLLFDFFVRTRIKVAGSRYNIDSERLSKELSTIVDGWEEFYLLKAGRFFVDRVSTLLEKIIWEYSKLSTFSMSSRLFLEFLIVSGISVAIAINELTALAGQDTLLSLSIIGAATIRIIPLMNSIVLGLNQLRAGSRTVRNVSKFIKLVKIDGDLCEPSRVLQRLEVGRLTKSFDGQNLIKDFFIDIGRNQSVAIVGPSGCGKSTLAAILCGIAYPDSGSVLVEVENKVTKPIQHAGVKVGYVSQQTALVEGTVLENLSLKLDADPKDDRFSQALKLSGFDRVLQRIPLGLDARLGEGAMLLSGGQRQKLAISRALMSESDLLILDEPTSAFDDQSEQFFFDQLDLLKLNRILIVVTHSKQFLNKFDTIIEFGEQGSLSVKSR